LKFKKIVFGTGVSIVILLALSGRPMDPTGLRSDSLSDYSTLVWNTFLGGAIGVWGSGIALDGARNVYISGESIEGWGNPIRPFSGGGDAFVAKLDSSGALQWSTFLGGDGWDGSFGEIIAIDGSGNVYITGESDSSWGNPIRTFSGGCDAFVAKLDSSGALQWSTFLGGEAARGDYGRGIAVDGSGNVYVTGNSYGSWGIPINPFYVVGNSYTVFVAKLDPSGALQWNTFLGGGNGDAGMDIAIGGSGNVYVMGNSASTWGNPIRPHSGAFIGDDDVFVAKLDPSGALQWNTFLGGKDSDEGRGIAIDGSGNLYIAGWSHESWGSPIHPFSGGFFNAFAAKLDPSGTLQWSTFLGGVNDSALGFDIAVDVPGNVYLTGRRDIKLESSGFGHFEEDGFWAKFDPNGGLLWDNSFGGREDSDNESYGIAVDGFGSVYVTGMSSQTWGNPILPYHAGTANTFVAKFITPSMTVASPAGGLAWILGTTREISWLSRGVAGNVNISLYKGTTNLGAVVTGFPVARGVYSWKSGYLKNGAKVAAGSDYRIFVVSTAHKNVKAVSEGYFSLIKLRISVRSPVDGTIWRLNSSQRITWTYMGVGGAVDVFLYRFGILKGEIASGVPVADLGCSWTVGILNDGTRVPVGTGYSISVKAADNKVSDRSGGTFTIGR
jgi:hypothetical protein